MRKTDDVSAPPGAVKTPLAAGGAMEWTVIDFWSTSGTGLHTNLWLLYLLLTFPASCYSCYFYGVCLRLRHVRNDSLSTDLGVNFSAAAGTGSVSVAPLAVNRTFFFESLDPEATCRSLSFSSTCR